jgi:histidine triad (HIT) family protein
MLLAARSLAIPEVARCLFCDYLAGARPYTIARRDAATAILVTREQRGVGHVLVIPLACRPTLLDLSPAEAGAVMATVQRAGRAIVAAYEPAGLAVWQNNGIPARQFVPHVHFHLAGTLPAGGTEWGPVAEISVAATDAIAARLYPALAAG